MADPKNQKIIAAIVARMQTILTSNGFQTDIGTRVADSQPNWQEEDLPAISVYEGRTPSAEKPDARRTTIHEMPVLIKCFLKRDTDASNARIAIADIKKAIRGDGTVQDGYLSERWPVTPGTKPGLAMETRETAHSIEYAEGTFEITGAQVEIEVQYITGKFNAEE